MAGMNAAEWYIAERSQAVGPMTREQLVARLPAAGGDDAMVYGPGLSAWTAARHVPGLLGVAPTDFAPPPMPAAARRSDEIDYTIYGEEMQFVEIELDPNEMVIAEAGAMMYMTQGIQMQTIFGDASQPNQGFFDKLMSAGKRLLTGESLFLTAFANGGARKEKVAFAAPYPGSIVPMDLAQLGGEMLCQKDSFLCAARGVQVGIAFTKRLSSGLFGGEGFILQRLSGDGVAFVHAGGALIGMNLAAGEKMRIDTGCIVAFQPNMDYAIEFVGGIKNALFGGEGLFFATITGPGKLWLQSLPFVRLADRVNAAGGATGTQQDQGSILGGFGRMIQGD
jgi:uncharacterized protein (TIGR00266 family)